MTADRGANHAPTGLARRAQSRFGVFSHSRLETGYVSAAFDTLKFVERLGAGGFSPIQARAAAGAFAVATGEQLVIKWMLGFNLAATVAVLFLFVKH